MSVLPTTKPGEPAPVRIVGIVAIVGGIVGLASHPLLYEVAGVRRFQSLIVPVWLAGWFGAFTLVWGVCAAATRRWRPLTPKRALVAPVVVAVPWIVAAFQPGPRIDPLGPPWTPPTLPELFTTLSTTPAGGFIGGAVLLGAGVAVARAERRWTIATVGLAVLVALNMGRVSGHYGGATLVIATFGAVPAVLGYVLAAPRTRSG